MLKFKSIQLGFQVYCIPKYEVLLSLSSLTFKFPLLVSQEFHNYFYDFFKHYTNQIS